MSLDDLHSADKSIAISVLIRPSRWMQILCVTMSGLCLLIGLCVVVGHVGAPHAVVQYGLSAIALAAAVWLAIELHKQRRSYVLDITGAGDIRLQTTTANSSDPRAVAHSSSESSRSLVAGSVITPMLLVLRLADNHGNINTLLIFTDSVSHDAFRRLSLACRWLAGHRKRRQPLFRD